MARPSRIPAAVLALMAGGQRHAWSIGELRDALAGAPGGADFSSLFRAAARLVAEGRLRKLRIENAPARYELAGAHHDHLRCSACAALVPVPCLASPAGLAALERATGFAIASHDIVLDGLCPACQAHPAARPGVAIAP